MLGNFSKVEIKHISLENDNFFCVIDSGYPEYCSEAGGCISYLFVKGIGEVLSTPGGPSKYENFGSKYSNSYIEQNFFSPIIYFGERWYGISRRKGHLSYAKDNVVDFKVMSQFFNFQRRIELHDEELVISDEISDLSAKIELIRPINLPVCIGKNIEAKLSSSNSQICVNNREMNRRIKFVISSEVNRYLNEISFSDASGPKKLYYFEIPRIEEINGKIAIKYKVRYFD